MIPTAMALQDMHDLEGAALQFTETKGYGPFEVDLHGWALLHHAASESQHSRSMFDVIRGVLEGMPNDLVNQKKNGGTPSGWAALSLVSNARDHANVRADIARMLVENGGGFGGAEHQRRHALDERVRLRHLVVSEDHPGHWRQPPRHQLHRPQRLGRHAEGPGEGSLRATEGSHRC